MYLSQVHIQNFRSFATLDVKLHKGLNVIVGENNVGKTNLLDAIRIGLGAASTTDPVRLTKEDRHRLPDGSYVDKPIAVHLTFSDLSEEERAAFIDILDFNAAAPELSTARIQYEWTWANSSARWSARRVGGGRTGSEGAVPDEVLQAIPVTMLGALRDALVALSPGRTSRLAKLLSIRATDKQKDQLTKIITAANESLQSNALIADVESLLDASLENASGPTMRQSALIRASEPQFDRIVTNLRLVLRELGQPADTQPVISELRTNGLGYNNLLYIATALAELDAARTEDLPLLLVEEPEAHLHPQLQTLLADFLARGGSSEGQQSHVQTIVTTHSPTLAAHVSPDHILVLHRGSAREAKCTSIVSCGLSAAETKQLRRMFDVTKATLLFSRGVMLVEGITEALLLPVLARRMKINLAERGVSVVPVSGVDFNSIGKLFGGTKILLPVAVVTDGDPAVVVRDKEDFPYEKDSSPVECPRVSGLKAIYAGNTSVSVFASSVTLEYDLAQAADDNGLVLFDAWARCHRRPPRTLKKEVVVRAGDRNARALLLWRKLCRGSPAHGKAELAQHLADMLEERNEDKSFKHAFEVPEYIAAALRHVAAPAVPRPMPVAST